MRASATSSSTVSVRRSWRLGAIAVAATVVLAGPAAATASVPSFAFSTPVFGLATAPDGSLLVADYTDGVVELRGGAGAVVAAIPNATDVAPLGRGSMFVLTGGGAAPTAQTLFRVSEGRIAEVADLGAFEAAVNPDGGEVDSNPFDVAALTGGSALVADAGANALLIVDARGNVDWVATLPDELVSTADLLDLLGCPDAPPPFADLCFLPPSIPAQGVATGVVVGPDGAYYVGELKGFPGPFGESRIWRIAPGTRHAHCGASAACSVVGDGFTSIVDLNLGPDGTLYVTEMDEASFMAVELGFGGLGGTVNACTWSGGGLDCDEVATGLPIPIATTVGKDGTLYAAIWSLVPGLAEVVALP